MRQVLTGSACHNVDAKNRVFIPAKFREVLGDTFMVACSVRDRCLKLYSMEEWDAYIEPITHLPREISEPTIRLLHATASQVTPDAQGRILLTPALMEHAKITKQAKFVGCNNYAEVWDEQEYQLKIASFDMEAARRALEGYGL